MSISERLLFFITGLIPRAISFFIMTVLLDISDETRKARRILIITALATVALHVYEIKVERFGFFAFSSSTDSQVAMVSILAFLTAYGTIYFFAMLIRDHKITRIEKIKLNFANKLTHPGLRITETNKEEWDEYDREIKTRDKREKSELNALLFYAPFNLLIELAFPLCLAYFAINLSSGELLDLWQRISVL